MKKIRVRFRKDAAYCDADWKEGDHPRAANGQFGSGGGSSTPSKSKAGDVSPVVLTAGGSLNGEKLSGAKSGESGAPSSGAKSEPAEKPSEKRSANLQPKLSSTEKSRLTSYSGDSFLKMNTDLRNGVESDESKGLDKIIAKGSIPEGTTLYRGMSKEAFKKMLGGDTVDAGMELTDKAFMSTSTSPSGTMHDMGGVRLHISVGEGQHGIDMAGVSDNPAEKEVLLPRNTKLVVTGIIPGKNIGDPHVVKVKTVGTSAQHRHDAEGEKERKSIEGMRKWHNSPECKKMFAMAEKNGEDRPKIKVKRKV